ncbi:hypothetical protein [Roseovarius litorisediminis]|nr:hypothetical protein [Roseovarius litorisediminis]
MQIVLHAGAHMTDEDRLINCLTANSRDLAKYGTSLPSPRTYRKLIRDVIHDGDKTGIDPKARDEILSAVMNGEDTDRLVLSNASFFGSPKMSASAGVFYNAAESRLDLLQQIFPNDEIELFMAICNPATFLPAIFEQTPFDNLADYLRGAEPTSMRWSGLFERLRAAFPDIAMTVWCNEDTPLIWGQVLRELSGVDPTVDIAGEFSLLSEILSDVGMKRFEAYLAAHPNLSEIQKRRVIAAFLDKFAEDTTFEIEVNIPGWTEGLIAQLTEVYDDDIAAIQQLPGVNVIMP